MKGITGNPVLDAYGRMAITPVGAARPAESVAGGASAPAAASTPAAEVSISSHARDMAAGGHVDAGKVDALKSSIAEGKLKIDSHNVARRMLDALG